MNPIVDFAMKKPGPLMWIIGLISVVMIGIVAVPTLYPNAVPFMNGLHVDTDPENMLSPDEPVRLFHNEMKAKFGIHDYVVVGIVEADNPDGIYNVKTLGQIYDLTEYAKNLQWDVNGVSQGVVGAQIIAPSMLDSIEQAGLGSVSFSYMMKEPPQTRHEALLVREKTERIPPLVDTLSSVDGKAMALYLPITAKDVSYDVAAKIKEKIATFDTDANFYITGLPVAQDQFGSEMFKQMAASAPAAMALIFLLMWLFFRKAQLIIAPMLVAMVAVIAAMGVLITTGNTVHIMSSMIPIFVMPIAVLNSVHILSDFYDRYPEYLDRKKTLLRTMNELWWPMVFTSATTVAGFGALAFTPIPPVQTFGIFVAFGVFLAWLTTILMVPAYIMLMPEKAFAGFGLKGAVEGPNDKSILSSFLRLLGSISYRRAPLVILFFVVGAVVAGYGITKIEVNDNPVKWFSKNHEVRIADAALNERFAGTYISYLTLAPLEAEETVAGTAKRLGTAFDYLATDVSKTAKAKLTQIMETSPERATVINIMMGWASKIRDNTEDDDLWVNWDDVVVAIDSVSTPEATFKQPDVLHFVEDLQQHLMDTGYVGKSNAVTDIVKTVHRELYESQPKEYRIPSSEAAVAQTLVTFENSHRPNDLYKMVTPDFRTLNIWVQLKTGDNKDMNLVVDAVDEFMTERGAEYGLTHQWFGLSYINTVWQDKMVTGMMKSFAGSFVIVLMMMALMFRSLSWGLISMAPLTITIGVIYGAIGLIGKSYDMPIAVLSSLSLGLAVDYAIHFNARTREAYKKYGAWKPTLDHMFGEPARAILRNVIVIGAGFMPLLLAPLVPYQTVGIFISAILVLAGVSTLLLLPATITLLHGVLFRDENKAFAAKVIENTSS